MLNLKSTAMKAFTLIEVLLVIGFIALAAAGVYVVYSKVDVANKVHTEANYINTIAAGTRKLFSGSPFPGAAAAVTPMNATLIKAKVIPDKMVVDPTAVVTTLNNNFGGGVIVSAVDVGAARGFQISTDTLPADVCAQLASELQLNFNVVKIGTTLVLAGTNAPTKSTIAGTAYDQTAAVTACSGTSNAMIFQGQ